jgi:hypothetical protein
MEKPQHTLKINPLNTAIVLFVISVLILILSLLGQRPYGTGNPTEKFFRELFTTQFFINNGENIATYWNMLILIIASALIFVIARLRNAQKDQFAYSWYVLGILFVFFAVDTLARVSPRFAQLLRDLPTMEGGFLYNWLYPVTTIILLLVFLFFIWFYLHLEVQSKFLFPLAMLLYTLGAYKAELLSGYYARLYGTINNSYLLIAHVEELAEYAGVILIIYLLLTHLAAHVSELEFTS